MSERMNSLKFLFKRKICGWRLLLIKMLQFQGRFDLQRRHQQWKLSFCSTGYSNQLLFTNIYFEDYFKLTTQMSQCYFKSDILLISETLYF